MTINIQPQTMFRTPESMREIENWIHEVTPKADGERANMFLLQMMCHNFYATLINKHQDQDKQVVELFADFTRRVALGEAGVEEAREILGEYTDHKRAVAEKK